MKISKKLTVIALSGLIAFGSTQSIFPIKAEASTQENVKKEEIWRQKISLQLIAKRNHLYKDWWSIDLVAYSDGSVRLEGNTNIPFNLTFSDTYAFGLIDSNGQATQYRTDCSAYGASAELTLYNIMKKFNESNPRIGHPIFIHGVRWNDTVKLLSQNSPIIKKSNNDFNKGYKSVDRWKTGFYLRTNGLEEADFYHSEWGYSGPY